MIISPVFYLKDVALGVYDSAGRIAIASEYGCEIYSNILDFLLSKTTSYEDIIFLVLGTYTIFPFFFAVELQRRYRKNPMELGDIYLTPVSQYVQ